MTETPTITIDYDKHCTQCGNPGAVNGAVCMACLAKILKEKKGAANGQRNKGQDHKFDEVVEVRG